MKTLMLDDAAVKEVVMALQMRMAWIETGNVLLRAIDVQAMLDDAAGCNADTSGEVRPLSISQMKLIIIMDDLVQKLLC
jgi:hypothetical protein